MHNLKQKLLLINSTYNKYNIRVYYVIVSYYMKLWLRRILYK